MTTIHQTGAAKTGTSNAAMVVQNLSVNVRDSGAAILKKINIELTPGKVLALVGESGSGKSVTSLAAMRLLPDALRITSGEVLIEGQDVLALSEAQMQAVRGHKVAMIFQNAMTALNPVQKVGEQIGEVLLLHRRLNKADVRERVIKALDEVGIPNPEQRLDFYPHQLSGGQQQRVMIAMALACEPDILIADEPTTALDVTIQEQVLKLIRELTVSRQLAVLLITHDMGVVFHTADTVAVMYHGDIIEQAPVGDFFRHPQQAYSRRLIDALPDLTHYQAVDEADVLLKVDNLKVHFPIRKGVLQRVVDYTRAVDGVSMRIDRAKTYALVGESGSGKSTLGRAILRLEGITDGEVWFDNTNIAALNHREMHPLRKRIQVIFQNPHASMNPRMTVAQVVMEGMESLGVGSSRAQRHARVDQLLQRVQLDTDFRDRYPHELSGGQLQRVAIARALAVEPDLIICDEPTSALDVSIRAEVLDLLQQLQDESGVSYLFITHDLSIIPALAHYVGVMQSGKLVEQGSAEKILTAPEHPYTKALLASVPRLEG